MDEAQRKKPVCQEIERLRRRAETENKGEDQVRVTSFWHVQRLQVYNGVKHAKKTIIQRTYYNFNISNRIF